MATVSIKKGTVCAYAVLVGEAPDIVIGLSSEDQKSNVIRLSRLKAAAPENGVVKYSIHASATVLGCQILLRFAQPFDFISSSFSTTAAERDSVALVLGGDHAPPLVGQNVAPPISAPPAQDLVRQDQIESAPLGLYDPFQQGNFSWGVPQTWVPYEADNGSLLSFMVQTIQEQALKANRLKDDDPNGGKRTTMDKRDECEWDRMQSFLKRYIPFRKSLSFAMKAVTLLGPLGQTISLRSQADLRELDVAVVHNLNELAKPTPNQRSAYALARHSALALMDEVVAVDKDAKSKVQEQLNLKLVYGGKNARALASH